MTIGEFFYVQLTGFDIICKNSINVASTVTDYTLFTRLMSRSERQIDDLQQVRTATNA